MTKLSVKCAGSWPIQAEGASPALQGTSGENLCHITLKDKGLCKKKLMMSRTRTSRPIAKPPTDVEHGQELKRFSSAESDRGGHTLRVVLLFQLKETKATHGTAQAPDRHFTPSMSGPRCRPSASAKPPPRPGPDSSTHRPAEAPCCLPPRLAARGRQAIGIGPCSGLWRTDPDPSCNLG